MTSNSLTIATVASDPSMELKGENESFSEASIGFGAANFNAKTIGCVVTASRELAEDAPNFASIIEGVMARALAAELDRQAIQGSGSQEIVGLTQKPDIDETGSVGAIAWEDLATAAANVRLSNHEPSAAIVNVQIAEDLSVLTSGDGSNSAKLWLGAPPSLEGVQMLPTTGCPIASAIVGDFSYAVWGIRSDVMIEMTTEGGDAFQKHQVKFKVTFRGDFNVTDESAFYRLAGITS